MNAKPRYVTTQQLYKSQQRVKLVCEFYGPTHPKCKRAVSHDTALYIRFLKQFKIDDDEEDLKVYKNFDDPVDTFNKSNIDNN